MDRKLTARIDISKASQAGDLELGQEVSIVIRGKVTALRGPSESLNVESGSKGKEEKYTYPGSIEIQLEKFAVEGTSGFEALLED
jgi:hypothetical protein